jgi:hypothetical protein
MSTRPILLLLALTAAASAQSRPILAAKASNSEESDRFGSAVSISGNTMAVGATREDSSSTVVGGDSADNSLSNSGAVYVFEDDGLGWQQISYIKPSQSHIAGYFGLAVALDGDTLAVASQRDEVFIYVREQGAWSPQALIAETFFADAWVLDLSGDVLVIGDPIDFGDLQQSGAAYVYERQGSTWSHTATLQADVQGFHHHFGEAVAVDGDTIIVGCPGNTSSASGIDGDESPAGMTAAGAAFVYERGPGGWEKAAFLKSDVPQSFDFFGASVDVSGDMLAVGTLGDDNNTGSVSLFSNAGTRSKRSCDPRA